MKITPKASAAAVYGSAALVLISAVVGVTWSIFGDDALALGFWGSALGTAVGGATAVSFALWIWQDQKLESLEQAQRQRSSDNTAGALMSFGIIADLARENSDHGMLSSEGARLIANEAKSIKHYCALISDETLKNQLLRGTRYLSTENAVVEKMDEATRSNFFFRASFVHIWCRGLVQNYLGSKTSEASLKFAFQEALDPVLEKLDEERRETIRRSFPGLSLPDKKVAD